MFERRERTKVYGGKEPSAEPIVEQDMLPLILVVFAFCFVIERELCRAGFDDEREQQLFPMLTFADVHRAPVGARRTSQ